MQRNDLSRKDESLIDKAHSSIKRYGIGNAILNVVKKRSQKYYHYYSDIVFVIPDFKGYKYESPDVKVLDKERVSIASERVELSVSDIKICERLLHQGCKGVYAEVNGRIAAYSFMQFDGVFPFPFEGACSMIIPPKYAVARNLYVLNEYRGMKLGQVMNEARLSLVSSGTTPVVFIIPENKYAIRNWEKFGFRRIFTVQQSRILSGKMKVRFSDLNESIHSKILQEAIISATIR